jgi:cation:H+ antiporter
MIELLLLLTGFLPLIYGAHLLVEGASSLARRFSVPDIVIGLTIVAFGTSTPELIVNVFAAVEGDASIALGNVLGSNIFNILGILGITALILPLQVKSRTTWIEIPLCVLAAAVLFVTANDRLIEGAGGDGIGRIDGIILLLFFSVFFAYVFHSVSEEGATREHGQKNLPVVRSVLHIGLGLLLLIMGGRLIVVSAVKLAQNSGVPERIIALTIVAIGTSLPELATSVVAAFKKNVDIAIGNVVGSNIFNTFLILGISAVIHPLQVPKAVHLDLLVNGGAAVLLFVVIFLGKGRRVDRVEGAVFVSIYIAYVIFLLLF